jgi:mono/diheme cytochrome c family protein
MNIREIVLVGALVLMPWANRVQDKPTPVVPPDIASGKLTYEDYCAACHGADGRGQGPVASALKTPPANLRTLAIRHDGKFPEDYVTRVVRSGGPIPGHGSSEMPIWGPVFSMLENGDELGVRRRIKNLCNYLASIQDKKS